MFLRLQHKVAWVTGAGSGIGAAIARGFLLQGARVVLSDTDVKSAKAVALSTGMPEDSWLVHRVDVGDRASVEECATAAKTQFHHLDILVANAGITVRKPFLELTDEDFEHVMAVNAQGVFICSQIAARMMIKGDHGAILHIASQTAINARINLLAYGASKAAVVSMTRHMALELGPKNIRVNAICPGTIRTELTRHRLSNPDELRTDEERTMLQRIGEPEDIVGAAIFLVSDESRFVTGATLFIDGGETSW